MQVGRIEIDDKAIEWQDKIDDMVMQTAKALIEMSNDLTGSYFNTDMFVTDFVANLIDCVNSIKYGFALFEEYRAGLIDRKTLYELMNKANMRPRYKEAMKMTIEDLIKQEEREVG